MRDRSCDTQRAENATSARGAATGCGAARASVVLRLVVQNHPGVMSHVCGLFHRRLFNVDGIACLPTDDASRSAVLLLVREDERLEQVVRQLAKLVDVLGIERDPAGRDAFATVAGALGCPPPE
jgi:acetolactate synthase-1/3 small subunit